MNRKTLPSLTREQSRRPLVPQLNFMIQARHKSPIMREDRYFQQNKQYLAMQAQQTPLLPIVGIFMFQRAVIPLTLTLSREQLSPTVPEEKYIIKQEWEL